MAIQTQNLAVGTASIGGATPDYTPPAFQYKDADEITIKSGRYYQGGYRLDGQYQDTTGLASYWDVTAFDADVDGASLVGGDVVDSWYSVFLTAADAVVVLPIIRVDALDYNVSNAGKTTINPADHDDGTTANNSFVSAADVFNGYRLLLLSDTAYHGSLYTIEDTVDGTPDEIVIDGDVSAEIAATEWLQMVPGSGTSCVYLGCIRLDSSGDIVEQDRNGWVYDRYARDTNISGQKSTSAGNTDLGAVIPPTARRVFGNLICYESTSCKGVIARLYQGSSGTNEKKIHRFTHDTLVANRSTHGNFNILITAVGQLRNMGVYVDGSNAEQAITGTFLISVMGFEE
jgi:hypothetical protein